MWLLEKPRPICIWCLGGYGVLLLWTIAEFPLYVMSVISTRSCQVNVLSTCSVWRLWASGVCGMVCMVSALIWMRNVPHRLWSLNTWSPVGGVDEREFRRRGLSEGRTSLRVSFESSQPYPISSPLSALCSLLRVWFLSSPLLMLSLLLAARLPVWDGLYLCGVTGQPRLSSTSVLHRSVSSQWQKRHLHSTYHPLSQAYSC